MNDFFLFVVGAQYTKLQLFVYICNLQQITMRNRNRIGIGNKFYRHS